jgi:hypothetical protein
MRKLNKMWRTNYSIVAAPFARRFGVFIIFFLHQAFLLAQTFPPPAGQVGSTAISKDSSIFKDWAVQGFIQRGWQDISAPALGPASAGDDQNCTGLPLEKGSVSLGDGGSAICTFNKPVYDGPGFDFAVFENSFDGLFLELAFVEVSSDGLNFFRFPAESHTDTTLQTGTFGNTDARKLNHLAGKYASGYGTPFDLNVLSGIPTLNLQAITHIKVVDVVGSLNSAYCSRDAAGRKINDPWPTPFPQGGFDLDAIGVIHSSPATGLEEQTMQQDLVYPNPAEQGDIIHLAASTTEQWLLQTVSGGELMRGTSAEIESAALSPGLYVVTIPALQFRKKLIIY